APSAPPKGKPSGKGKAKPGQSYPPVVHVADEEEDARHLPPVLLIERAYAYRKIGDLVALGALKKEPLALEVLAEELWSPYFHGGEMEQTMFALARLGDDRAVDVFRKLLGPPTNWYVVDPLPQVLLELGSPKGVPLLEELIRRAERKEEHPHYNGPA